MTGQQLMPAGQATYLVPLEQYNAEIAGSANSAGQLMFIPTASVDPVGGSPVMLVDPGLGQAPYIYQQPAQAGIPTAVQVQQPSQFVPSAQARTPTAMPIQQHSQFVPSIQAGTPTAVPLQQHAHMLPVAQPGFPIALPTQHPPQMIPAAMPPQYVLMTSNVGVTSQVPPLAQTTSTSKHQGDNTNVVFSNPVLIKMSVKPTVKSHKPLAEADLYDRDKHEGECHFKTMLKQKRLAIVLCVIVI